MSTIDETFLVPASLLFSGQTKAFGKTVIFHHFPFDELIDRENENIEKAH